MPCQRCGKDKPGIHTCTATPYVARLEEDVKRLRNALRQIADKGDDQEYGVHQKMRQMALDALREGE